jgi:N-formylglutamate amidohydrolase
MLHVLMMTCTFRQYPKALQAHNIPARPSFMTHRGIRYDPYLAAGYARTERVVADTDFFIDDMIRKVVLAPSHRTDKHTDVVCFRQRG